MKVLGSTCLAALVLGLPVSAFAVIGPDVTVSTIDGLQKYGTVSGVSGYAMTTVSCNLGDRQAIWIDCTSGDRTCNQHPVIAQTAYKLYTAADGATRFEEIGFGWLKHGFCGADAAGPRCAGTVPGGPATCNNDNTCDGLGVGCTDTYGAGLNADQANLGPRSEINAYSGYYPYPYLRGWNATGNAIFKRMQIRDADLTPNSNLNVLPKYFAECQYVVTDEAAAVRTNNVTWRQAIVAGTASNPTMTFSTPDPQPRQPAIYAWRANDPGVQLTEVDLPNDGRMILGYKVTQLANGLWHYEYALYNMNSHQCARSFSVPAPDWYTFNNQGFHDVAYHSGEITDGTDWVATKTLTDLSWEMQPTPAGVNALNGNAVRWGTTYNFRFDTASPPGPGYAKINLFQNINQVLPTPTTPNPTVVPPSTTPVLFTALVPQSKGDTNCDGLLNNLDIDGFVQALTFPDQYIAVHPNCPILNSDIDNNGFVTNFDIDPFVAMIVH